MIVGLANHTLLIDRHGVEHPIDDSAAPIRGRDGGIDGCVLVFRDISERRQAESALRGAEARVRDALMQMGTPALLYAEDGEMLLVNQAFVEHTGYSHADVPTVEVWTRRAYGERQPMVMATIRSLFGIENRVDSGERELRVASGASRTWHFFTGPAGTRRRRPAPPDHDRGRRHRAQARRRFSCARRRGARTSSWRCWRTSCAIRWRRSATRSRS